MIGSHGLMVQGYPLIKTKDIDTFVEGNTSNQNLALLKRQMDNELGKIIDFGYNNQFEIVALS